MKRNISMKSITFAEQESNVTVLGDLCYKKILVKSGIEMSFKRGKEVGVSEPPKIDLRKPIDDTDYDFCSHFIIKANEMLQAETCEEIFEIVDSCLFSDRKSGV